ncbi:MAG: hypothetical protein HC769_35495 [Cyanobacteria bacterium CRU_2_1]|nr:hypothetical protein [Cyanobacteria bacterium CRU_2_1]
MAAIGEDDVNEGDRVGGMSEIQSAIDGENQLTTRLERTGRGDRGCSIGYRQPLNRNVIQLQLLIHVAIIEPS